MDKKFKIAQVITRMDWAGAPDIARLICEGSDSDYDWKLIIGKSRDLTPVNRDLLEKYKNNIIELPGLRRDINLFWDVFALFKLYCVFKKEKFDLVQLNTVKAGFLGRIAAKAAGVKKVVYMPHGHVFYGYFGRSLNFIILVLERFAAGFCDKIIVLTKLEKNDFVLRRIKQEKDIEEVCSGLEIDILDKVGPGVRDRLRDSWGIGSSGRVVGMVSRLEAVKGPVYFVKAAALIVKDFPEARFIVAGEGSLKNYLEKLSRDLGLKEKIIFLGWRDDPLEIISSLDILAQPSLNEAVGRVLLEAQALGVAVVASKTGGIPEIVKDKITGLLVDPADERDLAEGLTVLLKNDTLRKAMALSGKDWARDNFNSKKMVEKINDIYRRLLV